MGQWYCISCGCLVTLFGYVFKVFTVDVGDDCERLAVGVENFDSDGIICLPTLLVTGGSHDVT